MDNISIQIQSILYNNEKKSLLKSLKNLRQAIKNQRNKGELNIEFKLAYGDASEKPIFSEQEINEIKNDYKDMFDFTYRFFGFNTGHSHGQNILGENCKTDYMMIMNPDVLLSPDFFIHIMKPFKDDRVGIVEGRQTPIEHPKDYNVKTGETAWASGAAIVFPTSIFHEIKGFDYKYFYMYCDDVDFSWRVRLLNKKIIYQPLAIAYHSKSLSSKAEWQPTSTEKYYSDEAALMMAHKWSNPKLEKKIYNNYKKNADKKSRYLKIIETYDCLNNNNDLPTPLDKEHKVSKFVGSNYAKHRFVI